MCRKHTWHGSGIIGYHLSPKSVTDEIREKLGLKMVISFFPKCVISNSYYIIGLYLLIYIEHKGTIEFWSNGLTKTREKIDL